MSDDESLALAEKCRRELDDLPYYEGTLRRDACIARWLREAGRRAAEALARRLEPPEGSPLTAGRLEEIRAAVAARERCRGYWQSTNPLHPEWVPDLLAALDHAHGWCAALADGEEYQRGRADGVAAALAGVEAVFAEARRLAAKDREDGESAPVEILLDWMDAAMQLIRNQCGPAEAAPHAQVLEANRRMREARRRMLADTADGGPTMVHEFREMAREALS